MYSNIKVLQNLKPLVPFKSIDQFNIWVCTLGPRHSFQGEWLALCLALGYETSFHYGITEDLLNAFFTKILFTFLKNVEGLSDEEEIQKITKHLNFCPATIPFQFISIFIQQC